MERIMKLHERARQIRIKQGLSTQQLANLVGIGSSSTISRLEANKDISLFSAMAIFEALGEPLTIKSIPPQPEFDYGQLSELHSLLSIFLAQLTRLIIKMPFPPDDERRRSGNEIS